jgi:hypothetical protein
MKIIPIDPELAAEVRKTSHAPGYGHPAHREMAAGYGPCRSCLRKFRVNEERRILFTYDPFRRREPFPLPGPIFVHEEPCSPFAASHFPPELADLPLTLEAYAPGRELLRVRRLHGASVEAEIASLLAEPRTAYLHVRNTEAGCFICEIAPG